VLGLAFKAWPDVFGDQGLALEQLIEVKEVAGLEALDDAAKLTCHLR
jgi:hypothetical protein